MLTTLAVPVEAQTSCQHTPQCPPASAPDHDAAHITASHPEQGWFLRCNGIVSFTDTGDLYPDRHFDSPHRNEVHLASAS